MLHWQHAWQLEQMFWALANPRGIRSAQACFFGASRHNRRSAQEVKGVCPEVAMKLEAAANQLFQRGHEAMPLA